VDRSGSTTLHRQAALSPHAGGRGVKSWQRDLERSRPLDRHNEPLLVAGAKKRELERSVGYETSLDFDYVTNM
jgi:hypothetical protein